MLSTKSVDYSLAISKKPPDTRKVLSFADELRNIQYHDHLQDLAKKQSNQVSQSWQSVYSLLQDN